jgi:heme/copper-type cytochrome/quinol oxidase subunit 3
MGHAIFALFFVIYINLIFQPTNSPLEPDYAERTHEWSIVHTDTFLLAAESDRFYRAFHVPFRSPQYTRHGDYVLLQRIHKGAV